MKPPGCRIRSGLETFKFFQNDFLRKRRKLRSCFLQLQDSGEIAPGLIDGCQLCVDAAVVDMTGNCKFQQLACLIGISGITQFLGIDGSISFKCGKTVITCAEFIQVCNTIFKFQVGVTHGRKIQHFLTDMNDFAKVNEVYGAFFGESKPARSCVAVAALPKAAKVEIECIVSLK